MTIKWLTFVTSGAFIAEDLKSTFEVPGVNSPGCSGAFIAAFAAARRPSGN